MWTKIKRDEYNDIREKWLSKQVKYAKVAVRVEELHKALQSLKDKPLESATDYLKRVVETYGELTKAEIELQETRYELVAHFDAEAVNLGVRPV